MLKPMTLSSIAVITGGQLLQGNPATEVNSYAIDSRQVKPGSLFVALPGERVDGHDYLAQARATGAVAALVQRQVNDALPQIVVGNGQQALAAIAGAWRQQYRGKVVGITGSCGKTSTKEMLGEIFRHQGSVLVTQGNRNNEIGVPLTLLDLKEDQAFAVVEMGAAQKGDIAWLMQYVQPDITVITNARMAHLGRFGSEQTIADTKGEIYTGLPSHGRAVVNRDEKYCAQWLSSLAGHEVLTVSLSDRQADLYCSDIQQGTEDSRFVMQYRGQSVPVRLALPGLHNISNALCAGACALLAGLTLQQVAQGLSSVMPVKSRMQKLTGNFGGVLIDDCYNANPDSVRAAIDVLSVYDGRRILVLGDMAELGPDSERLHAAVGGYANGKVDVLFTCGHDTQLASQAFSGSRHHYGRRDDLLAALPRDLQPGDVVLVKGSRSAAMEVIVDALTLKETA